MEPSVNTNARDIATLKTENKTLFKNLAKHEGEHDKLVALMHSIDTTVAIAGEDRRVTRENFEGLKADNKKMREDIQADNKKLREDIQADNKKLREELQAEIKKVAGDMESLKDRPRKRIESIITAIILAVVGVIVGIVFSKIGLTP